MAKRNLLSKLLSRRHTEVLPPGQPQLKFIFFISEWSQTHAVSDALDEHNVNLHFVSKGQGTATSEILDLLGIGSSEKAVTVCLVQAELFPVLMKEARKKLRYNNPGQGIIAFTIPLSAINDPVLLLFQQDALKNKELSAVTSAAKENKGEQMAKEFAHDLIVSIVNHGYSDDIMNTARAAGATGGTILNARSQAHEGVVKFFGVSVQDEKEILLILTSCEKKVDIMRAASEAYGLNSQAHGIIFSLPVDDLMGFSLD